MRNRKEMVMKKLLSILVCMMLAAVMVVSSACGKDDIKPSESTESQTSSAESTDSGTSSEDNGEYVADVPIKNFGGTTITFLARSDEAGDFATWDLEGHPSNKESVNTAIAERNRYIEETFGVEIKVIYTGGNVNGGDMRQIIYNDWHANTQSYNIAYCSVYDAIELAGEGLFYDLSELDYIDLNKPWWDINAMKSLSLADRYFFGIGDLSIQIYETLPCLVFNKELVKRYSQYDLYKLVEEGKWTMDKLYEICKDVYLDDDDVPGPSVKDIFGIGGQNDNMWNFFYGSGARTVQVNKYGEPELTLMSEKNVSIVTKIMNLMNDRQTFFNVNHYVGTPGYNSSPIEFVINGFKEGRIMFYSDGLLHLDEFADVDFDFGILPTPKYSEDQDSYHNIIGVWGATAIVIPTQCPDLEATTIVAEAMAAKSKNTVSKEYFEKVLNIQSTRDSESEISLRIILNTKGFDMGRCFDWGKLSDVIFNSVWNNQMTMGSDYEMIESKILTDMNSTIARYTDLPHYYGETEN